MQVVILAGGKGTRFGEMTRETPKPMIEIGGRPILWHLIRYYANFGYSKFSVALGHKGNVIRDYFTKNSSADDRSNWPDWKEDQSDLADAEIRLVETGEQTNTGGRIKRFESILPRSTFMLTWGDGLSDVDLHGLLEFHRSHGRIATVTAVHPTSRFGLLEVNDEGRVDSFTEKPPRLNEWINGAFFVLEPEVFDYIEGDSTQFEKAPLERLASSGNLMAYRHESFWHCMDNQSDRNELEKLWQSGTAPWKVWK